MIPYTDRRSSSSRTVDGRSSFRPMVEVSETLLDTIERINLLACAASGADCVPSVPVPVEVGIRIVELAAQAGLSVTRPSETESAMGQVYAIQARILRLRRAVVPTVSRLAIAG